MGLCRGCSQRSREAAKATIARSIQIQYTEQQVEQELPPKASDSSAFFNKTVTCDMKILQSILISLCQRIHLSALQLVSLANFRRRLVRAGPPFQRVRQCMCFYSP